MNYNKQKFIFIHVPKTGGTSIKNALYTKDERNYLSDNDLWHCPVRELTDIPDDCFKFAYVRNPWDRFVSLYQYFRSSVLRRGYQQDKERSKILRSMCNNFTEFCHLSVDQLYEIHPDHFRNQYWFIEKDAQLGVDFIGRFENMWSDFKHICNKIEIPIQRLLRKNSTKHPIYTEYYDEKTKQLVADLYTDDIEHFGYKFGE